MPATPKLGLPYLAANQAQKHVTVNESLRLLDALIQIAVETAAVATPPATPAEGQSWIVAASPSGAWAGQGGKLAAWQDGAWVFHPPRDGWIVWDRATAQILVWRAGLAAWAPLTAGALTDATFVLQDDADPSKQARIELAGLTPGTTRVYGLPDGDTTLTGAALDTIVTGSWTFENPVGAFGTATATASYGLATGVTAAGNTKSVDIGTGGAAGSNTLITLGPVTAGAAGQMVINTALVTFASHVTDVAMPAANLTALHLGLGGASADATNRLSVNAPATLLNHAGAGHEVTVNKAGAGADASLAFKTGFSARALAGLLGSDDFTLKVSPDGSSFLEALVVDRLSGRVRLPLGLALDPLAGDPGSPAEGWLWHNGAAGQLRARIGGVTRALADQGVPWLAPNPGDHALTTTGAGAATATQGGAANRMEIYPFIPRGDLEVDRLSVNVTTLIAAALGKIVVNGADEAGQPDALMVETADLDFSSTGVKSATVALTLRRGTTYWIGIRHSANATLSSWPLAATPDLNGGAPVTTARKVLRRSLAYATAAPSTWGFLASEINAGPAIAIWLRAA